MRVLIVSVTAGYGHHASAKAVSDRLEHCGARVLTVDLFKYISKLLYDTIDKGYLLSVKYARKPYGQVYSALETNRTLRRLSIANIATDTIANRFLSYIEKFNPDVIVCTHVFPAMIMDELKSRGRLSAVTIGIITDFTVHPFWDDVPNVEYIVVASELLTIRAKKHNIDPSRILPFGIPVQTKFTVSLDKAECRRELGIQEDRNTVLIMGGSMGSGNIEKLVKDMHASGLGLTMLCVCGNNKKLRARLSALEGRLPIKVYGFTDNVDVMMEASDCIVTKPGGLTVTEALCKKLPMILVNPLPGQEERNTEFLLNNGVAMNVTKSFPIGEAVFSMFSNNNRLRSIQEALISVSKPNSTADLCNFILNLKKDDATPCR